MGTQSAYTTNARATAFHNIPSKPIDWLWQNYIPRGKLSLLAGDPGSSKTTLALDLAARLSRNDRLPPFPPSPNPNPNLNLTTEIENQKSKLETPTISPQSSALSTLLLSPEDNLQDTLRPRLEALNANLQHIHTLPHFHSLVDPILVDGYDVPPLKHLEAIIQSIPNLALLVIDPITYYLGLTDRRVRTTQSSVLSPASSVPSPRSILHALSKLAEQHNIAILLTTRLTKKCTEVNQISLRRVLGSLAFASACRTVNILVPNSDLTDPDYVLFAPLKSNVAELPPALSFYPTDRIDWDPDPIFIPHPEKPDAPPGRQLADDSELGQCVNFLKAALANGPIRATTLIAQAKENLLSPGTLRRAKDFLDLDSHLSRSWKAWFWCLKGDTRPILTPTQVMIEDIENEMRISDEKEYINPQHPGYKRFMKRRRKRRSAQVRKKRCAPLAKICAPAQESCAPPENPAENRGENQ